MDYRSFDENFSLEGKYALITGASSGIGLEIAKMYLRKGADIFAFDLASTTELTDYAQELGRRCLGFKGDITNRSDIERAVQLAEQDGDGIDILVNCAGIGIIDKAEDLSEEVWDKTMNINLKGSFLMAQQVGRSMLAKKCGGSIICISSQAGVVALDKHIAYGVSKAALIQLVKQFALEWAQYDININAISPTVILTPLGERVWNNPTGDEFKKTIPAKRFGYPEEVAAAALFLASDAARLINGANLVMDGGFTIA